MQIEASTTSTGQQTEGPRNIVVNHLMGELRWMRRYRPSLASEVDKIEDTLTQALKLPSRRRRTTKRQTAAPAGKSAAGVQI